MKKLVVLTGAGMSVESGFSTFRGNDGLWGKYPVEQVASHSGWLADPVLVNNFYNDLRRQLLAAKPNRGHELLARMEKDFDVQIITQNVDNLHERAGSSNVLHLHGELMKVTSSANPNNPRCIQELTAANSEVKPGQKAADGSLLRPFIVFFQEDVPNLEPASHIVAKADAFVIIGTSLNVYPAASLVYYLQPATPIYLIDPNEVKAIPGLDYTFIRKTASEGIAELQKLLK